MASAPLASDGLVTAGGGAASLARLLALIVPAGLLGGALFSQYVGGLHPCEMCYWQRWPHGAAILLALVAFALQASDRRARALVAAAAIAIAVSGAIGVYHWGVEEKIFTGLTTCSSGYSATTTDELLKQITATPLVRCDEVQWRFLGLSLAAWNAIFSLGGAFAILLLLRRGRKA